MTFADKWNQIQSDLSPGAEIKNWTTIHGYIGDSFKIYRVSPTSIIISSPGAKNLQSIPKQHFEKIHYQWGSYCQGSVQRQELRDATRFSKYIISILHHVTK